MGLRSGLRIKKLAKEHFNLLLPNFQVLYPSTLTLGCPARLTALTKLDILVIQASATGFDYEKNCANESADLLGQKLRPILRLSHILIPATSNNCKKATIATQSSFVHV
jgi:hypothetical protein